ncbi:Cdc6/Cdc18 family protein [Halobium palmae]|uniref:ORC1-type DNA replication protein n=1 Tax=Halobium palmae TaxID=1776492 RepID=A0ABD5RVV3_9EURY
MPQSFGSQGIFRDEDALRIDWTPNEIPEREAELKEIHNALAPATRGSTAHNLFLSGKTGQGKTVAVRWKMAELKEWAEDKDDFDLTAIWLNCNGIKSSYQCGAKLVEHLTGENPNGHTANEVYERLCEALNDRGGTVIIILDEIDNLGESDELLYTLPRARSNGEIEDARVSLIGISNDFSYVDDLSPKVKGTLCEEEVDFPAYDANQLRQILHRRAEIAFLDGVVGEDAVALSAALAANDKGSARQAIRFLYKAGEIALDAGDESVTEDHVRTAKEKLERKRIVEGIRGLTRHDKLALTALLKQELSGNTPVRTKQVYTEYCSLATRTEQDPLVQRSLRDHLQELGMLGIIDAEKRQSGIQGGDHFVFSLNANEDTIVDVLCENEDLQRTGIAEELSGKRV